MYKKMTALHSQRNAQTSRMEEMEAEMAQVQLELSDLQTQCEDKDAQVCQMTMNISSHFNGNQILRMLFLACLAFNHMNVIIESNGLIQQKTRTEQNREL